MQEPDIIIFLGMLKVDRAMASSNLFIKLCFQSNYVE